MTSPSVGDAEESSPNISPSLTRLNARGAKQSINTFKQGLTKLVENPQVFSVQNCFIGQILGSIPKEDSELFKTALGDKRIRHVDLVKLCASEGFKMSEATMRRHRAGGCRCLR